MKRTTWSSTIACWAEGSFCSNYHQKKLNTHL